MVIASTDSVLPLRSAIASTAGAATIDSEAAVAAEEREEIGVVGDLRLALPFLVGDEIVDAGERDVEPAVEQRR